MVILYLAYRVYTECLYFALIEIVTTIDSTCTYKIKEDIMMKVEIHYVHLKIISIPFKDISAENVYVSTGVFN